MRHAETANVSLTGLIVSLRVNLTVCSAGRVLTTANCPIRNLTRRNLSKNEGRCPAVHVRPYPDDRFDRDNQLMWWVGLVEGAGNLAAVTVLGWRIRSTWRARWWSLLALQASAAIWFMSNVMYAVYFVMWERFEVDWWSGVHYDVTKGAQQLSIMLLPLTVLGLMWQLFSDYRKAAQRLTRVHDQ